MGYPKKSYKKFVATAATATLVATALVPAAAAAGFSDVAENNEFKPFIDALSEQGIIKGYTSDNTFHPYQKITRGQVTIMLGRWLEKNGETVPADWATNPRFSDVSTSNEELAKYAALVKDAGVFEGVNGELLPYQNITREHIATVLDRASQQVNGFTLVELAEKVADKEVVDMDAANADYRDEIQALVDLEISTVSNFRPKEDLTRAQFAKFLYKTMNVTEQEAAAPTVDELLSQLKDIENTLPAVEAITADNADAMKEIADKAAADIDAIKEIIEQGEYSEEEVAKLDQMIRDVNVKLDGVFLKIEEVTAEAPVAPTAEELLSQLKDIENTLPAVEKITADNADEMKAIADKAAADIDAIKKIIEQGNYSEEEVAKLDQMIRDVNVKLDGVFLKIEEVTAEAPAAPTADELLSQLKDIENTLPAVEKINADNVDEMKAIADKAAADIDAIKEIIAQGEYSEKEVAALDQMIRDVNVKLDGVFLKIEEVTAEAPAAPTAEELKEKVAHIIDEVLPSVEDITAANAEKAKEAAANAKTSLEAIKEIIVEGNYAEADIEELHQLIDKAAVKMEAVLKKVEEVTAAPTGPTVDELKEKVAHIIDEVLPSVEDITAANAEAAKEAAANAKTSLEAIKEVIAEGEYSEAEIEELHQWIDKAAVKMEAVLKKVEEVKAEAPVAPTVDELKEKVAHIIDEVLPSVEDITATNAEKAKEAAANAKTSLEAIKELIVKGDYAEADVEEIHQLIDKAAVKMDAVLKKVEEVIEAAKPVVKDITSDADNKVTVVFDKELDYETVTNVDNYDIGDVKVESAVPSYTDGTYTVTLTLGDVEKADSYEITVKGVKSKVGVEMDSYTTEIYLQDNVRPTVTKAEISAIVEDTIEEFPIAAGSASVDVKPKHGTVKIEDGAAFANADTKVTYKVSYNGKVIGDNGQEVQFRHTGYSSQGLIKQGGVEFRVQGVKFGDEFTLSTVAAKTETVTTPGTTTVTLTFSEAVNNGKADDFELFIKGEHVEATVSAASIDTATPNVLTLTINKDLTADFENGVQLKAAGTLDIVDQAGNALELLSPIDLKLK